MISDSVPPPAPERRFSGPLDIAVADLAADNDALTDRVRELEADVRTYQCLFKTTLHALHDVTQQRDQAYETIRTLRRERSAPDRRECAA